MPELPPERWKEVSPYLDKALSLPENQRVGFVASFREKDPSLAALLDTLLNEHQSLAQEQFLEKSPIEHASLVGRRLGPYQIEAQLGAGGMGEVYRAKDTRLERTVAIKFLPRQFSSDPSRQQRFEREAKAISALQHPNICTLFDVGQQDSLKFLVMEHLEGETLSSRLLKGALPPDKTLQYGIEVADALDTAHRRGIVHRDLKPGNIFITLRGETKVLDFGLAKLEADAESTDPETLAKAPPEVLTTPGIAMGTVAYMSPEQARGEELDSRTDIFSFGSVLYEMATGQIAFSGKTTAVVFHKILNEYPESVTKRNPTALAGLEPIVTKALEKDCDLRYQSAAELRADLKRLKRDIDSNRWAAGRTSNPREGRIRESAGSREIASPEQDGLDRSIPVKRRWTMARRLAASGLVGATVLVAYAFLSHPPPPRVTRFLSGALTEQLDSYASLATDGVRVFFLERHGDHDSLMQVSTSGGEAHAVDTPFQGTRIFGVSPDRSEFLIGSFVNHGTGLPLWIWPVQGGSPVRVGNTTVDDATWCLDGQQLLYVSGQDIHIVRRDGNDDRILVHTNGYPRWMRWHPDGSRFSYSVTDPQTNAVTIWEAAHDGSNPHLSPAGSSASSFECCGEWTKDGEYFLFTSSRTGIPNLWAVRQKRFALHWREPEAVQLTSNVKPMEKSALTPDGTRAFAMSSNDEFDFVRFDLSTKRYFPLPSPRKAFAIWYSRDGNWIVAQNLDWTLWKSRPDGRERFQLTSLPLHAAQVRWAPDGKRIVMEVHEQNQPTRVRILDVAGGAPQEFVKLQGAQHNPSWSPDGTGIAVAMNIEAPENSTQPRGIYITDWKTGESKKVPGSEGMTSPQWSPDGKYFIAKSNDEGELLLFNPRTKNWRTIAKATFFSMVAWSKDASYLYYQNTLEPGQPVYRLRAGTFQKEKVLSFEDMLETDSVECLFDGFAAPDSIIVRKRFTRGDVYALDLDLP